MENRLGFLEDEQERLKANPAATSTEVETLRQKVDDIENRERRNNLCFVGFPGSCEDNDAVIFLERVLPKILYQRCGPAWMLLFFSSRGPAQVYFEFL